MKLSLACINYCWFPFSFRIIKELHRKSTLLDDSAAFSSLLRVYRIQSVSEMAATLSATAIPEQGIVHREPDTKAVMQGQDLGIGTMFISEG